MKRLALSLLLLIVMLASCSDVDEMLSNNQSDVYIFCDTDDSAEVNTNHEEGSLDYVVNVNSKIYHYPSCIYAKNLADEHKEYFSDREFLIERGYKSCKKCIK